MLQAVNQAENPADSSPLAEGKLRILEVLAGIPDGELGVVRLDDVKAAYKQQHKVDLDEAELNKLFANSHLNSTILEHFVDDIQLLQNADSPDSFYVRLLRPSADVLRECAAKRAEQASPRGGFGTRQTSNFSAQGHNNGDGQRITFQGDRPWRKERNGPALQPILKRHPSFLTDNASTALRFKSTTNTTLQSSSSGTSSNGTFMTNSSGLSGSGGYGPQQPRRDQFRGQHGRRFTSAPNRNENADRRALEDASQYSAAEDRFGCQTRQRGFGVSARAQAGDNVLRGFKREGTRCDFRPLASVKADEIPHKRFGVQHLQENNRDDSPTGRPSLTPIYHSDEVKTTETSAQLMDGSSRYDRGTHFGATPPNPASKFARASVSTDEERSDDATQQLVDRTAPVSQPNTTNNPQSSPGVLGAQRMGNSLQTDASSMDFKTTSSYGTYHRQFGSQQAKASFGSSGLVEAGRDLDRTARRFGGCPVANDSLVHSSSSDQSVGSPRDVKEIDSTRKAFAAPGASNNGDGNITVDPAKLDDHTLLSNAIVMIVAMNRKDKITISELEDLLKLQCHREVSPRSESGLDISWTDYIRRFCSAVFVEDDGIQEPFCILHSRKSVVASQVNDYVKRL
ncbi:hypothetical protein AAVH_09248 [Aphelenchoides avenae]|nr:hypothetical protein AAVH_09248 [Aphelenchus avenae]